jgi:hypothetical protein
LRQYAELKTVDLFPENPGDVHLSDQATYEVLQQCEESLLALKPENAIALNNPTEKIYRPYTRARS